MRKLLYFTLAVGLLVSTACTKNRSSDKVTIHVDLSTKGNNIEFDQTAIQAPFGKEITLEFKNLADPNSEITHNIAVIKQGLEDLVLDGMNDENYEFSHDENHFKDKDYFEVVSDIIEPTKEIRISFTPKKPGFYTYICLMPGHGNILKMIGKLYVRPPTENEAQTQADFELRDEYVRPKHTPHPEDNQFTEEKMALGKKLFFDPILSRSKKMACATCHVPGLAFQDSVALNIGDDGKKLARTTPTLMNLAWGELFFWDGRAETLEEQALGPIESSAEMNLPLDEMEKRLKENNKYIEMFEKAFSKAAITAQNAAKALATFQRTLVSKPSRFDKWVEGDEEALNLDEKLGFELFNGKAKCAECHSGWRFSDDSFHDIGLKTADIGRGKFVKLTKMKFAFKTPTLRELSKRAPYMHDGQHKSLGEVIEFYNRGGDEKRPSLAESVVPLKLSDSEKSQIIQFLGTLDSP